MRLVASAVAAFISLALASSTSAAPVSIYFTGTFASIQPNAFFAYSQAGVHIGSLVTGKITIDTATADLFPADPTHGEYNGLLGSFSISSGGWSLSEVPFGGENYYIYVYNQNQPSYYDYWEMNSTITTVGVPPTDPGLRAFTLLLQDNVLGANIVSDSTVPPSGVAQWYQATLSVYLPCSLGCGGSTISLTSVVVPEPSLATHIVALAVMLAVGRGVGVQRLGRG